MYSVVLKHVNGENELLSRKMVDGETTSTA